jgi:hypothetical protein
MNSEEMKVRNEVAKRIRRAHETGVVKCSFRLFRDWLSKLSPKTDYRYFRLPDSVLNVVVSHPRIGTRSFEVFRSEGSYIFEFIEDPPQRDSVAGYDGPIFVNGQIFKSKLAVKIHGDLLLELLCIRTEAINNSWDYVETPFQSREVSAFIDGPWVNQICDLTEKTFGADDKRQLELREQSQQQRFSDLKNRFGI